MDKRGLVEQLTVIGMGNKHMQRTAECAARASERPLAPGLRLGLGLGLGFRTTVMAPFDLDACIQQLLRKQLLHEALLREICEKTKEVLMRESNVVHVSAPVTVVGDIHG